MTGHDAGVPVPGSATSTVHGRVFAAAVEAAARAMYETSCGFGDVLPHPPSWSELPAAERDRWREGVPRPVVEAVLCVAGSSPLPEAVIAPA